MTLLQQGRNSPILLSGHQHSIAEMGIVMSERFSFPGMTNRGWFDSYFEPFQFFDYAGDKGRLAAARARKTFLRQFFDMFASNMSLAAALKLLANVDLGKPEQGQSVGEKISKLLDQRDARRTLVEFLALEHKKQKKGGRYFEVVGLDRFEQHNIFRAKFDALEDELVTVEGQLIHRDAVKQYSDTIHSALGSSRGNWLLSDFPPHGLVDRNSEFTGKILLLQEDENFSPAFADILPFYRAFGWYPYVRITGFFNAKGQSKELFPRLSISLIEYRRPKSYLEVRDAITTFIQRELHDYGKNRNYLEEWSEFLLFGYLAPILFLHINKGPEKAEAPLASLLHEFAEIVGADLPIHLRRFYDSIPKPSKPQPKSA